jgi:CARDB
MKNLKIIFTLLLGIVSICNINTIAMAQKPPTTPKTDIDKPITDKLPITDSAKPISDLTLTELRLSTKGAKISGMRTIYYTVKNIGRGGVRYNNIELQGYLHNDDVYVPSNMTPACGSIASNTTTFLKPNQTFSGSFNCTDNDLFNRYQLYILYVDVNNKIPEINENNNHNVVGVPR